MEETKATNSNEILQTNPKKEWEAPKLYSLDKGKTEGGEYFRGNEDDTYFYS